MSILPNAIFSTLKSQPVSNLARQTPEKKLFSCHKLFYISSFHNLHQNMPPQITPISSQLAEVAHLRVRLSVARDKRGPLLETLDELRTRYTMKYAELNKFQHQINQSQAAADAARSENRMDVYDFHLQIVNEKKWVRQRYLSQWEELGKSLEKVGREVRDLEVEISELKRMLNE